MGAEVIDSPGERQAGAPAGRLKKRPDFLRAATGRKSHSALFTVQCVSQLSSQSGMARAGFTVTKKVGNAVERNRIRRRLREIVRVMPDLGMQPAHDYVIVARRDVLRAPVAALGAGLRAACRKVHAVPRPGRESTRRSTTDGNQSVP